MALCGNERESPARAVTAMLGDRWTTLILLVLQAGELRHADLRRAVARLSLEQSSSPRVLTQTLRALERDGFVLRRVRSDVPLRIGYRLSPLGGELVMHARSMIAWINAHAEEIRCARAGYDRDADALD